MKEAPEIRPEQYFFLNDGTSVKNLYELLKSLNTMDDNTFGHHVNEHRNDFGNWIRDVLANSELADQVSGHSTKPGIIHVIEKVVLHEHEKKLHKEIAKKLATMPKKAGKSLPENISEDMSDMSTKMEELIKREEEIEQMLNDSKKTGQMPQIVSYIDKKIRGDIPDRLADFGERLKQVLRKETEIEANERKIEEIEERLEKKLDETEAKFFSRDFLQGVVTGALATAIVILTYLKFVI
ncbi:MAG: hypothetical protein ABH879_08575 [archaeon]